MTDRGNSVTVFIIYNPDIKTTKVTAWFSIMNCQPQLCFDIWTLMLCAFCFETSDVMIRVFTNGPVAFFQNLGPSFIFWWSLLEQSKAKEMVDRMTSWSVGWYSSCCRLWLGWFLLQTNIISHSSGPVLQSKVQSLKAWPGKSIISVRHLLEQTQWSGVSS